MKVGVLGKMSVIVRIELDKEFDRMLNNSGYAKTHIGGRDFELAKKLATKHETYFVGSQMSIPYMKRLLEDNNINSEFADWYYLGNSIRVEFVDDNSEREIENNTNNDDMIKAFEKNECGILDELDVLVITYISPQIIKACQEHNVELCWYPDEDELEEFDPDDECYQLVMDMPFVNLENCLEVI